MLIIYVRGLRMSRKKCLTYVRGIRNNWGVPKKRMPKEIRDFFARMGKRGGQLGGKVRASRLTPEERSEAARKAVTARWERSRTSEE